MLLPTCYGQVIVVGLLFCGVLESTIETATERPAVGLWTVTVKPPPFTGTTAGTTVAFGVGTTATLYGGVPPVTTKPKF